MADFDLELWHIPGANNKADALSRRSDHDDGSRDNEEIVVLPDSLFVRVMEMGTLEKRIQDRQQVDKDIWTEWEKVHKCTKEEGALFKDGTLVVTAEEQLYKNILSRYHDGVTAGHPGIWKTWQAIRRDYWWPTLRDFVVKYIRGCAKCQSSKTIHK